MPEQAISHKFTPGEHVTLSAMVEVEATEGPPQILVICYVRAEWVTGDCPAVRYYCRALVSGKWRPEQRFFPGKELINGLLLLDEAELIAYSRPEKEAEA